MKPLPAQRSATGKPEGEGMPSLPINMPSSAATYSSSNRRASSGCTVSRAYPWLLLFSTAVAGLFCALYITKPVIVPAPVIAPSLPNGATASSTAGAAIAASIDQAPQPGLMPGSKALPGEGEVAHQPLPADPRSALPTPPAVSAFEETNMRVQHVLTAEAPGGHMDRIVLDVPVLYHSRHLRWTDAEATEARGLMVRLMEYQEKSRALRAEGMDLLDAWNRLIERSIPTAELRADSPSLPANQQDAADMPRPQGLISTDAIQFHPAGK